MTFDEVLEQVIALLKRQGRVSYRALKMRFELDDEYLDVLKEELIDAQRVATDEDGRILVWTGNIDGTTETASQPDKTTQQPLVQHHQPTQSVPPPSEPCTPEAERRKLTVMFCDLVESTKLSSQLDPEDLRTIVREYQKVCSEVITRFDGHIAQLLGDGLLIYFGYPHAHEDDAQRAVRTGLGILDAMGDLNTRLKREKGIQLALRMSIHTGLVVVGDMGGAGRQEQLALGEVPNLAARLQGLAEPNTIAVSEVSYRLIQGYFTCESLGEHALRGVTQPLNVYRVLGESGVHSRLDIASARGLTPLVQRFVSP
jgi:class 3 adenylate cyclase